MMERMLGVGPEVVRGFRGARNWLLVRSGSPDHQQLLSLLASGLVMQDPNVLPGFARFKATAFGCAEIGLTEREIERAIGICEGRVQ